MLSRHTRMLSMRLICLLALRMRGRIVISHRSPRMPSTPLELPMTAQRQARARQLQGVLDLRFHGVCGDAPA